MSLHTNSESKGSDLMRNPVPKSEVLSGVFGLASSSEITKSVKDQLNLLC